MTISEILHLKKGYTIYRQKYRGIVENIVNTNSSNVFSIDVRWDGGFLEKLFAPVLLLDAYSSNCSYDRIVSYTENVDCEHDFVLYVGLRESFYFCKKCDKKEEFVK